MGEGSGRVEEGLAGMGVVLRFRHSLRSTRTYSLLVFQLLPLFLFIYVFILILPAVVRVHSLLISFMMKRLSCSLTRTKVTQLRHHDARMS